MGESIEKTNKKNKLPYFNNKTKNTHNEIIDILSDNFNVVKKREFIKRKQEYLEKIE